jgi:predicted Zn-dependent protease
VAELHCGDAPAATRILEDLLNEFPDYPPAKFIRSAAYMCSNQKSKGLEGLEKQKRSPMGRHLALPCLELGQSLLAAKQIEYALAVLGGAIECEIVNPEILDLFAECIKVNDEGRQPSEQQLHLPVEPNATNPEDVRQSGCAD